MALVRVDIHIEGEEDYRRGFQIMAEDARDLSEPLRRVGESIRSGVGEQFLTEGAARGAPWAPLSPKYKLWKEAHWPGRPILVRTGEMRGALLALDAIDVTRSRMTYEPHSDIAHFHQFGTRYMPARKMLVLRPQDRREWDRIFHEWIIYLRNRNPALRRAA